MMKIEFVYCQALELFIIANKNNQCLDITDKE